MNTYTAYIEEINTHTLQNKFLCEISQDRISIGKDFIHNAIRTAHTEMLYNDSITDIYITVARGGTAILYIYLLRCVPSCGEIAVVQYRRPHHYHLYHIRDLALQF